MAKFKVRFEAEYEVEIECDPKDIAYEASQVNIPEDDQTRYVCDTFEVRWVEDENGNEIEI